jgi:hypothetical protein
LFFAHIKAENDADDLWSLDLESTLQELAAGR